MRRLALPLSLLLPLVLAACGGGPRMAAGGGAYNRAYAPPGPAGDPWGPYISEAASRFRVRQTWIRAVMRQESGGHEYLHGQLTTSVSGAMGLMQIMPATYESLRERYDLGRDPYDPHDNIMAGAALIRELYVKYGSPAFLAAYNGSPRMMDDYLAGRRSLPNQTVVYLANVAPQLDGPMSGPLAAYAGNPSDSPAPAEQQAPVEVAEAAQPTAAGAVLWNNPPSQPAPSAQPPVPHYSRFALIASAQAEPMPMSAGGAGWGVQVGAFASPDLARQTADRARSVAPTQLASAHTVLGTVNPGGGGTLNYARLVGITHPAATNACSRLIAESWACLTVPPGG
jgi:hypothetical protein